MLLGIRRQQRLGDWYDDMIAAGDISGDYPQTQDLSLGDGTYDLSAEEIAAREADKTAFTPAQIAAVKQAMEVPKTLTAAQAIAQGIDLANRTLVNYNGTAYKYMPQTQPTGTVMYVPQRIGTIQGGKIISNTISPLAIGAALLAAFIALK